MACVRIWSCCSQQQQRAVKLLFLALSILVPFCCCCFGGCCCIEFLCGGTLLFQHALAVEATEPRHAFWLQAAQTMPGTPSPVWKKEVSGQGAEPAGSAPGTGAGQRTVGPGAGLVGGGPIAPGSHGGLVGGNSHHGHGAAGNVPGSTQPFKRSNDGFFRADDGAFRMVSMPPGFQKAASVPLARPQAASWSRAKGETRRVRRCKDCGCAECKGAQNGNSCEASEEQRRQWNKGNGNKKLTRPSRSKLATCVCCKVACWEKPRKHAANMRGKRTRLSAGPTAAGAPKARSDVPMFTHTSTPSQFHFGGPNSHFTGANGQSREAALLSGYGFNHAGPMGHSSMVCTSVQRKGNSFRDRCSFVNVVFWRERVDFAGATKSASRNPKRSTAVPIPHAATAATAATAAASAASAASSPATSAASTATGAASPAIL